MNFTQLLCFVNIVENSSFTLTAKKLSFSQSAVSKNIKDLEQSLNTQLLSRSTHGVEVTSAGKFFYPIARKILQEKDFATDYLNKRKEKLWTTLKIGFFSTPLEQKIMPLVLRDLKKTEKYLDVQFRVIYLDNIISELLTHQVDVCLVSKDIIEPIDKIHFESLISGSFYVSCSVDSPFSTRSSLDYQDLENYQKTIFLLETDHSLPMQEKFQSMLLAKLGSERIKFVPDLFTMDIYVSAGWGIGLLPNFTANPGREDVTYVKFAHGKCSQYGIAFLDELNNSLAVNRIVQSFQRGVKEFGYK